MYKGKLHPDKGKLHPKGTVERQYKETEEDLKFYWKKDGLDSKKTENVCCSYCETKPSLQQRPEFIKFRFPYVKCSNCGLVYPSIRPKFKYIEQQYTHGRFSKSFNDIYLPSAPYRMKTIFLERVKEIIHTRVESGRLLDIGSSSGHFLKVAKDHGYDTYGIEPNPEMVEFATDQLNLNNIYNGTTDSVEMPIGYFDIVTMWDVIEHVERPSDLLKFAKKVLKKGGWIFAYTENLDSFNYFINGSYSEMFCPDVHLRHYTPLTFRNEFEKAGFKVCDILTKGLDIQHIKTISEVYPNVFKSNNYEYMFNNMDALQEMINLNFKGDNLRLFAQKI